MTPQVCDVELVQVVYNMEVVRQAAHILADEVQDVREYDAIPAPSYSSSAHATDAMHDRSRRPWCTIPPRFQVGRALGSSSCPSLSHSSKQLRLAV